MEAGLKPPTEPRDGIPATILKTGKNPNLKIWGMLGILLVLLLLVVLFLPSMISDPSAGDQQISPEAVPTAVVEARDPEPDFFRTDAEQALQGFLRLQAQPDLDNADIWATDSWQEAVVTAARGDDEFGTGDFITALDSYKEATARLRTILDERDQTLQQSLESGWQFLEDNAVEAATAAFERVLAMDASHQQAGLGLERSVVREQILELLVTAKQAEISDSLPLAADAYTLALQLDPLYLPAQAGLDAVQTELQSRAFQESLGRALQGIEQGRFADAERALTKAAGIYPKDPAIGDARNRLVGARRQARLTALRGEAEQFETRENWLAANKNYARALKIDPQAAFARNGNQRSQKKIQLHKQLDHYLADVTRLYSDDPLNNARTLLAAHKFPPESEPLLAEKLQQLQSAVNLAVIPIDLLITSDSLTEVTIYRIGRLGIFAQKKLSLRPGTYTVKGSRQGYRDVLKTIDLQPGSSDQSLDIRTEEQI